MNPLLKEIQRKSPALAAGVRVVVFAAHKLKPEAHTLLFVLSVLVIVPLAALLSYAEAPWPLRLALATLAGVTVLVALVSEVFVELVQHAAVAFGMTPAFVRHQLEQHLTGNHAPRAYSVSNGAEQRVFFGL